MKRRFPGCLIYLFAFAPAVLPAQTMIAVRNTSAVVSDQEVAGWVVALDQQVRMDLAAVQNISARVVQQDTPSPGELACTIYDGDATDISLGDHSIDDAGHPSCEVNAPATLQAGWPISVVLSHEIIEMLVNPWLDRTVVVPAPALNPGGAYLFLGEVCDPVEAQWYSEGGVLVSDFVYPDFWVSNPTTAQMDQMNTIHVPLTPAAGYLSYRYTSGIGLSDWQTMFTPGFSAQGSLDATQLLARRPAPSQLLRLR